MKMFQRIFMIDLTESPNTYVIHHMNSMTAFPYFASLDFCEILLKEICRAKREYRNKHYFPNDIAL